MATATRPTVKDRDYLVHPQYIILTLVLFGATALFLGFSGAYLYNRIQQGVPPVQLPTLFYYNTLVLIASSYTLWRSKKAYKEDDTRAFQLALVVTFGLTLIFLVSQILAWQQLIDANVALNHSTMASYLYLISGLHFAHVIGGLPFLAYFIFIAYKRMKSPVTVLLYFADEAKRRRLNLLNIYWHFLDGLWIYLVLFFFINYLVK